jgi:hypothetical protein
MDPRQGLEAPEDAQASLANPAIPLDKSSAASLAVGALVCLARSRIFHA